MSHACEEDKTAPGVFETIAQQLGRELAILVDILNPERIVIDSIYARQRKLVKPIMFATLQ